MKKLFVAALSTFLVLGMAACGKKNNSSSSQKEKTAADFSDTVIKDGDTRYGILGPSAVKVGDEFITKAWGDADGTFGVAEATSLRDVANRSIAVAEAFEGKDLKGLYKLSNVELGHEKYAGEMKGGYDKDGNFVERDLVYGSKFGKYEYDDETEKYAVGNWIPSAEVYTESLTPETFWAPEHSSDLDEHGLDHNSNPLVLGGAGKYTYYVGVYKKAVAGSYYGFAVFQDEKLSEYEPPVGQVEYSVPGAWNSWDNTAVMTRVDANTYTYDIEGATSDAATCQGRIVSTGSWTTIASYKDVTVGNALVKEGTGDNNIAFVAAGDYRFTLHISGSTYTIEVTALTA